MTIDPLSSAIFCFTPPYTIRRNYGTLFAMLTVSGVVMAIVVNDSTLDFPVPRILRQPFFLWSGF